MNNIVNNKAKKINLIIVTITTDKEEIGVNPTIIEEIIIITTNIEEDINTIIEIDNHNEGTTTTRTGLTIGVIHRNINAIIEETIVIIMSILAIIIKEKIDKTEKIDHKNNGEITIEMKEKIGRSMIVKKTGRVIMKIIVHLIKCRAEEAGIVVSEVVEVVEVVEAAEVVEAVEAIVIIVVMIVLGIKTRMSTEETKGKGAMIRTSALISTHKDSTNTKKIEAKRVMTNNNINNKGTSRTEEENMDRIMGQVLEGVLIEGIIDLLISDLNFKI